MNKMQNLYRACEALQDLALLPTLILEPSPPYHPHPHVPYTILPISPQFSNAGSL